MARDESRAVWRNYIRKARAESRLTQYELAQRADQWARQREMGIVTQADVNNIESGAQSALPKVQAIAAILGLSMQDVALAYIGIEPDGQGQPGSEDAEITALYQRLRSRNPDAIELAQLIDLLEVRRYWADQGVEAIGWMRASQRLHRQREDAHAETGK
jgi:transcriptional regulator with XRE-family HTH domain